MSSPSLAESEVGQNTDRRALARHGVLRMRAARLHHHRGPRSRAMIEPASGSLRSRSPAWPASTSPRSIRSFPNACWSNLVREWLVACKDEVTLRTFINTTLGETYEQRGSARPWEELAARARASDYRRGQVPEGAALLFLGCDCQLDRIEWMLVGRGSNNRKFVVDYRRHPLADQRGGWRSARSMRCFDGGGTITAACRCRITMAAIDAGYETSQRFGVLPKADVMIIAVRGLSGSYKPAIAKVKSEKHGKRGDVLRHPRDGYFTVGIDSIKSQLFVDLSKDDPDAAGYIAFPSDCEDRLFQELTAEHRVAVKRHGHGRFQMGKSFRSTKQMKCWTATSTAKRQCRGTAATGSPPSGGRSLRRSARVRRTRRGHRSPRSSRLKCRQWG